jgi:lipoprotein-releasing system permease protein
LNLPFYIAKRYLFSKKSRNVINVITGISVVVIAFVTAAMVVVLSAFNGIDDLVDDLYSNFDGDLILTPERGRLLEGDSLDIASILEIEGVRSVHQVLEEQVLLGYDDRQRLATMRGVDDGYLKEKGLDASIYEGSDLLEDDMIFQAIIGYGLKLDLDASLTSVGFEPLIVHAPRKGKRISRHKQKAFNTEGIPIGGIFSINLEYDSEYLLVPYDFAKDIMDIRSGCSFIEILLDSGIDTDALRARIRADLPDSVDIKSREEKNALIYKANESERLVTICILSFIILIATFNILASLTMLMLDKRADMQTLKALGATPQLIERVFFIEGMLISALGALIGLLVGIVLCFAQQEYGLIPLKGGIVQYYPVEVRSSDIVLVFTIVLIIALVFSWWPVKHLSRGLIERPIEG